MESERVDMCSPVLPEGVWAEPGEMIKNKCMLLSWGKLYFKKAKSLYITNRL